MPTTKSARNKILTPSEKFQAMNRLLDYYTRVKEDNCGKFESRDALLLALKNDLKFEITPNNLLTLSKTLAQTEPGFSVDEICDRKKLDHLGFGWVKQKLSDQAERIVSLERTCDLQAAAIKNLQDELEFLKSVARTQSQVRAGSSPVSDNRVYLADAHANGNGI